MSIIVYNAFMQIFDLITTQNEMILLLQEIRGMKGGGGGGGSVGSNIFPYQIN